MKKNNTFVLNNRGASLIMVIVGFAFVAMLGSIVITTAINNIQMKQIDEKSKQSFYSAEAALDEIKVGLAEDVSKQMAVAYQVVLEKYSSTTEAGRKSLFGTEFYNAMKKAFCNNTEFITVIDFNSYLKETKLDSTTGNGAVVSINNAWPLPAADSIVFKSVKVVYQMNGYTSTITTDIKVIYPSIAIVSEGGSMENRPYVNYALIANNGLWMNTNSHNITGNIYAGNYGINISNVDNRLTINNSTIVTSGDITVKDKAQLIVQGTGSEVWAENLVSTQTDKALRPVLPTDPWSETLINVNGNSYIEDDLILSAYKSTVVLSGEYYGYSNGLLADGTSGGGSQNNSAIMINAAKASLNLTGLTQLKVAGRAFINMDKLTYTTDTLLGAAADSNSNILTGESLTIKGAQTPYLVPSEYIKVGHNPVTWNEYSANYIGGVDGMVNKVQLLAADIFVNDLISSTQTKFSYYLNSTTPIKCAFYKFGDKDTNVVYYYLNFINEEKATIFYKNYNLCYHDKLYNGFDIGSILVNSTAGSVLTAGNLITYDVADSDIQVTAGDTKSYTNNYASKYNNLIHTLQKNLSSTKSIYENIVNIIKVEADSDPTTKQVLKIDEVGGYVNIINNDDKNTADDTLGIPDAGDSYVFTETGKSGIIIATGDVQLQADFTGMIIAGGDIFLEGGANFTAAPALVNQIIMNYSKATDIRKVSDYINGIDVSTGSNENLNVIDVSQLIVYENWTKN
ncbi:MAG: hypothetical protein WBI07_10145 [Mobilitalea sp.]